jgi:UDP-N-acetylmuramoyl-L-alanyl-D-glutamate--2,6-diaminopimelate ligase
MMLIDLMRHLGGQGVVSQDLPVTGISHDTRLVQSGDVFVVIPCDQAENHARTAVRAGAAALIVEADFAGNHQDKLSIPLIVVASARQALSRCAALLYPNQPETMVAVTGTNGKSSCVSFVRQIWQGLGYYGASMGTLGVELTSPVNLAKPLSGSKLTTPDAISFHKILETLAASQVTHCAFEASSHGLDQYRLHGVRLKAAGFTNLSQDHLDYHGNMEAYFAAKAKVFMDVLPPNQTAIVNISSPYFSALKAMILGRRQTLLSYGIEQGADLVACNVRLLSDQIHMDLTIQGQTWTDIPLTMVGSFQVENMLCAVGLSLAAGADAAAIVEVLPTLRSARGRMELVGKNRWGSAIFIDYAHTPDALSRALSALRNHVTGDGRLSVVFGCGGNRDAGKRSQMGEVAQSLADDVFVTDDNPRYEDPAFIRAQILVGCPQAVEISDRRQALSQAIHQMRSNDILLIAGKGHEQGQIVGDEVIPFDDREEVLAILKKERTEGDPAA